MMTNLLIQNNLTDLPILHQYVIEEHIRVGHLKGCPSQGGFQVIQLIIIVL